MMSRDQHVALDRLLRPHLDRLYRLAFRLAGNRPDAEDLVQDVLVKAFDKADLVVSLDNVGTWLGRVLYNRFVDTARQRARRRLTTVPEGALAAPGIENLGDATSAEDDAARAERLDALDQALRQLSEEHRVVLLLHDTEAYKIKEIEELTGIPAGTIKSRLHRARARMKVFLRLDGTDSDV
jgi:RNA polymerase sigma-70 factor (ECF subfamily)